MILILVTTLYCIWCIRQLGAGLRVGGGTLIEHYMDVNALNYLRKYSTKGRDWQYTIRIQRANTMVERIKVDPSCNFEIISDGGMKFLIRSQTIHERWYAVNLGTKCCEYEDIVSICKHFLLWENWWMKNFHIWRVYSPSEKNDL